MPPRYSNPIREQPGDRDLASQFHAMFPPPAGPPPERAALFYPSAGRDLLGPLRLGLPYCRLFYFYDHMRYRHIPLRLRRMLRTGPVDPVISAEWRPDRVFPGHVPDPSPDRPRNYRAEVPYGPTGEYVIRFHHRGVPREIHLVCRDNTDFLRQDVDLAVYFHRGDSEGEGGSGQWWDGELLPLLFPKIPADGQCLFLASGSPWGLHPDLRELAGEAVEETEYRVEYLLEREMRRRRRSSGPECLLSDGPADRSGATEERQPEIELRVHRLCSGYAFCIRGNALPALAPLAPRSRWPVDPPPERPRRECRPRQRPRTTQRPRPPRRPPPPRSPGLPFE